MVLHRHNGTGSGVGMVIGEPAMRIDRAEFIVPDSVMSLELDADDFVVQLWPHKSKDALKRHNLTAGQRLARLPLVAVFGMMAVSVCEGRRTGCEDKAAQGCRHQSVEPAFHAKHHILIWLTGS